MNDDLARFLKMSKTANINVECRIQVEVNDKYKSLKLMGAGL